MGDTILIETTADEVVSIVTQGPQGPSGAEAATLTTTGDLLYRAALANDRLPIGSEGQVLKVASGLPVWGNESGAVTSVNGETGAVVLSPSDIGAQGAFQYQPLSITGNVTLSPSRATYYSITAASAVTAKITLPSGQLVGDRIIVASSSPWTNGASVAVQPLLNSYDVVTFTGTNKTYEFLATSESSGDWKLINQSPVFLNASDITSGTLTHERGGLEADVSAYSGLVKISGGSTSAVTVTAAGEALLDDATNADQRTTLGLGTAAVANLGTGASDAAYGNHTHADLHTRSHAITSTSDHTAGNHKVFYSNGSGEIVELALGNSGEVLTSNGASAAPSFAAASGGDTVSIDTTAADVLTATSGAISADDGGTIDSSDPFIKWDDTAGKLVYANPLSRPDGAFYVGLAPTTTALGTNAVNIQSTRTAATQVASGNNSTAVGRASTCSGISSVAIGSEASCTANDGVSLGGGTICSGLNGTALGRAARATNTNAIAVGYTIQATGANSVAIGAQGTANATLRGQLSTTTFGAIYWGGQTTNDTATVLNLDAAATNRFTIAANTALAVDILLVARRSDTADKWLVARRFLGIRRDGSNNTSLIGSVQTLGTDQSDGSPTWSFTLTADDTNEALQLEVTGAASETVQWRATAFYRVV